MNIMYGNLEAAISSLNNYVKDPKIKEGPEQEYHVIQANQTMNKNYSTFTDENYMICSGTYLTQLKSYWEADNKDKADEDKTILKILASAKVEKD